MICVFQRRMRFALSAWSHSWEKREDFSVQSAVEMYYILHVSGLMSTMQVSHNALTHLN